jgi:hypothetical protein
MENAGTLGALRPEMMAETAKVNFSNSATVRSKTGH